VRGAIWPHLVFFSLDSRDNSNYKKYWFKIFLKALKYPTLAEVVQEYQPIVTVDLVHLDNEQTPVKVIKYGTVELACSRTS
jgi:hypothetical protein